MNAILSRFCFRNEVRVYLRTPFKHDGFVYACNGHVAVRVPDAPEIEAPPMSEGGRSIVSLFEIVDDIEREWQQLPDVDCDPCYDCGGSGRVAATKEEECRECDGAGSFTRGSHDYDCKECRGDGSKVVSTGGMTHCEDCAGTGLKAGRSHQVGGQFAAKHYLRLFAEGFANAEIGAAGVDGPPADKNPFLRLRAPCGMRGVLMPMARANPA